jgi:hypothetical protein
VTAVDWFTWIAVCLAAYRLTRLVTKDTFPPVLWVRDRLAGGWRPLTEPETDAVAEHLPDHGQKRIKDFGYVVVSDEGGTERYLLRKSWSPYWLAELITCPWCASAYISGALTAAADLTTGVPVPVWYGLSVWAVAAVLASREKL